MRKMRYYTIAFVVLLFAASFEMRVAKDSDEALHEEIAKSAKSFDDAIDARNFKVAKEQLSILYPLMKKEFKVAKKQIHDFGKEGDTTNAEKLQKALERKMEIHDRLHGLAEASSASLRVQAADARALVKEYLDLLEEKQQLLSSVN